MKRIHVFEFEDLAWFPNWFRRCMTRLIIVMHKLLKTDEELAELLAGIIKETQITSIVDLCSGSAGPLPSAVNILKEKHGIENIKLTLEHV
ncbi:hypothetical protein R9C00_17445 [Flammeovirgaceae bacterium SG7u.111]|nr:hypothetical protein [Flammeovirgaceae bacterium SG7u.132]WPO33488.1 hypothetical protein R9C00_17445 [Flammeovirgaceae bacterium SG7u.111]